MYDLVDCVHNKFKYICVIVEKTSQVHVHVKNKNIEYAVLDSRYRTGERKEFWRI